MLFIRQRNDMKVYETRNNLKDIVAQCALLMHVLIKISKLRYLLYYSLFHIFSCSLFAL